MAHITINKLNRLLLTLCILITSPTIMAAGMAASNKMPPVVVNVAKAKDVTQQNSIYATGNLIAQQGITVKAETNGRITKILFKSGQYVNQGQPLVQIYPDILQAKLVSATAALKLSQRTFNRLSKLYRTKAISKSDLDTATAKLQEDKALVDQTKAQLDQTLIKAPFNGYLGIRQVSLGDYITEGQSIVNLQDTDPMYVDFTVPEKYLSSVKTGQRVVISSNAFGQSKYDGKIIAMESKVNQATRTLTMRAELPNPKHTLIPGTFVEVELYIGQKQQAVSVPQTAIVYDDQGNYVYRLENNKAIKTPVRLGRRGKQNIIITHGLKAGDTIVTAGLQKLHDGSIVMLEKAG